MTLLRVHQTPLSEVLPQFDKRYPAAGAVISRDLAAHEQCAAAASE